MKRHLEGVYVNNDFVVRDGAKVVDVSNLVRWIGEQRSQVVDAKSINTINRHWHEIDQRLKSGTLKGLTPYGTPATNLQSGDVFLTLDEARAYLKSVGFGLTETEHQATSGTNAEPAPQAIAVPAPVVTRSTKDTRRDVLTPVIELAQSHCKNPEDIPQVWTKLEKLAGEKYGPLVQMTQGELTYTDGGETLTISRDAISKRINRAAVKRRSPPHNAANRRKPSLEEQQKRHCNHV